jgi:hypothetical protein
MKIDVSRSSETSVDFQRAARRYFPEDKDLDPWGKVKVTLSLCLTNQALSH